MKSDRKKIIGIICLLIPFLAMLFMIGTNMRDTGGTEYKIEIEGYDPRDLLKGHYLVYRYKWPAEVQYKHAYGCACISGDSENPDVHFRACGWKKQTPENCEAYFKVERRGGYQPYEASRRFFIPEMEAPMIERLLREGTYKFSVGVVAGPDGQARVKELYISGIPLKEFLKAYRGKPELAP